MGGVARGIGGRAHGSWHDVKGIVGVDMHIERHGERVGLETSYRVL